MPTIYWKITSTTKGMGNSLTSILEIRDLTTDPQPFATRTVTYSADAAAQQLLDMARQASIDAYNDRLQSQKADALLATVNNYASTHPTGTAETF